MMGEKAPFRALTALLLALVLLGGFMASRAETVPDTSQVWAQYEARIDRIEPVMAAIARKKTHPCIYVTTLDQRTVESRKEYLPAVINVFNCPEEMRLTAAGGIRVRGNSTANDKGEKPYRIKFESKQNLLGLHGGKAYKSWVLLRSFWHLVPDYMAFQLAREIFEGKYYSSDCAFVNLYINGRTQGVYLLCEQNQAAKGRVDVFEPEEGETQTEIGYLLEMDNYVSAEHPFFSLPARDPVTDIAGQSRKLPSRNYSIKSDLRSREQEAFIHQHLDQVYKILYEASANGKALMIDGHREIRPADGVYDTPFDAVSAVIDLESLANMVILEELAQNYDVGAGSFFLAVDFSPKSIYPKLTFLAPWDFNWGYTEDPQAGYYAVTFQKLMEDSWERSNVWFILAMKLEEFRRIVKEKWRKLSESGALTAVTDRVKLEAESLASDLEKDSWKLQNGLNIVNYVKERIRWLDQQWR